MYNVIHSKDAGCYTVGSGSGDEWAPESDHEFRDDADRRAFFLNHGREMDEPAPASAAPVAAVDPWDLFAASALSGFLASLTESSPAAHKTAGWVADLADAMILERAKRKGLPTDAPGAPLPDASPASRGAFRKGQLVRHQKSGGLYRIVLTWAGDGLRIEGTDRPAYAYRLAAPTGVPLWVRDAEEMEDGRFVAMPEPVEGAGE